MTVQEQVGRFDIAVDDALVMGVGQSFGSLGAQSGNGTEVGFASDRLSCDRGRRRADRGRFGAGRSPSLDRWGRSGQSKGQVQGALGLSVVLGPWARSPPLSTRMRSSAISQARLPPSMNCIAK